MKNLNTKLEYITPAVAREYLKRNKGNRPLSQAHVDRLTREIVGERWMVTHQGIAFDVQNNLIDGQHRLEAIIASGKTVPLMVTRGLATGEGDLFTIVAIDGGRQRTVSDQLSVGYGVDNSKLVSSVCRVIALTANKGRKLGTMSVGEAVQILEIYRDEIASVIERSNSAKHTRTGFTVAALVFARQVDPVLTDEFTLSLVTGENIQRGEPVYALREHLVSRGTLRGDEGRYATVQTICNAIYNTMHGRASTMAKRGVIGLDFFLNKQKAKIERVVEIIGRKPAAK